MKINLILAILLSGDGDYAPLVKYVRDKGKKVEAHHFEGNISLDLAKKCNINVTIDKKIANKFFYREPVIIQDTSAGKIIRK